MRYDLSCTHSQRRNFHHVRQQLPVVLSFYHRLQTGWPCLWEWVRFSRHATCEKTRGWHFFEWFNASEVFGEIMIDYDYVECSSSALQALFPGHRTAEVTSAIKRSTDFMMSIQLDDGSWEGMWGICFTYGTWFGVEGLIDAGFAPSHSRITRACQFLVAVQKDDGGWGETFMSCVERRYVQHPVSQVVNTAWAVLSLLKAQHPDQDVIRRGVLLLLKRQLANGDWAQESISGVFNKNAMISYSNFKNIFPLWAIGRYCETYPDDAEVALAAGVDKT
jgi:lanosterol synthase